MAVAHSWAFLSPTPLSSWSNARMKRVPVAILLNLVAASNKKFALNTQATGKFVASWIVADVE